MSLRNSPGRGASRVSHGSFTVERRYRHAPARVFHALSDEETVRRWRAEADGCQVNEFRLDFRMGGTEVCRFAFGSSPEIRLDAQYQEIVSNERITFTYRMAVGPQVLSVSLVTIELFADDGGTRLVQTEQGAYFGDEESMDGRAHGTRELLDKLADDLDRYAGVYQ